MSFESSEITVAWLLGAEALPGHIDADRPALEWGDSTRTYGELRRRALSLAGALRAAGLERGDRVVGHMLNRGETFELYFACGYAGLTFVSLNWRLSEREIGLILADCTPRAVFTQAKVAEGIEAEARKIGALVVTLADEASGEAYDQMATAPALAPPFERTDPHLILYTSGTTGQPKGVMLTHGTITWFALQQVALVPTLDADAVLMITSPTFNTAGINEFVIPTFMVGGRVTIHPSRNWTPRAMADLIDRWGVTHCTIYPSMMEPLLEADAEETIELASLRGVATGGENCPPATMARFRRRWPHAHLAIGYGATESGIVTWIEGDEIARNPGSVGRVAVGMAVRIEDPDGNVLPQGQAGEICCAGGSIVPGYWNAPDLTAATLSDGWLKSGDLGRIDEHGYIYIEGRTKDLIISKGQNIYPAEVENALSEHDGLRESTVVGVPDPEWGEAVCAVIVPKDGQEPSADEVIDFVKARLASYKKPRHVVFVDQLPRNPGNKVLKGEVTERAIEELGLR